jgi:beta-mannosidase
MSLWSLEYIEIMTLANHELTKGWKFRETDSVDQWLPVASVPTNVHIDLIANKK